MSVKRVRRVVRGLARSGRRLARSARRTARRTIRSLRRASPSTRLVAIAAMLLAAWAAANGVYQAVRKPTELFFPVSGALAKTPAETWKSYGPLFVEHSTAVIPAPLLAALAQVEGSGNPVARTYWRFRPASNPFEVYKPASSAVGMYQITDATFGEAKRYCVHDHVVVEEGPRLDASTCWFNGLYNRVIPSHAIEMTAALLDRQVGSVLARHPITSVTPQRQQDLAAVIHLCGPGGGDAYAARGFRTGAGQRCGDHDIGGYLARVNRMKRLFAAMAAGEAEPPPDPRRRAWIQSGAVPRTL